MDPSRGVLSTLAGEILIFGFAAALLLLVRRWERLPWQSVGFGNSVWWKSLLWALVIAALCLFVGIVISNLAHPTSHDSFLDHLPVWLVIIVVCRAGFVEELFLRGYAIERLQMLGAGRVAAALIPLAVFAAAHYTLGLSGVITALALGAILTGFYMWRRDLLSNIVAHFLVDFLANVAHRGS